MLDWKKSSHCPNNATCVEVAEIPPGTPLDDNSVLIEDGLPDVTWTSEDEVTVSHGGITLTYIKDEWTAFLAGVLDGEFDPKETR